MERPCSCFLNILSGCILFFIVSCQFSVAQVSSFPYFENFDNGNGNWNSLTQSGTGWELGLPSAPGTQGAYSSPNCWGTDLDSGYRAGSFAYLSSPKFYIASLTQPYFSFRQFRYMSSGLDGMHMEYSTDDVNWNLLGAYGTPFGANWYNSSSIFSTGQAAFTGNSNGWLQSGISLDFLGSPDSIRFRFVFRSNSSFGSAQPGIFLDDVSLAEYPFAAADVALLSILSPSAIVNGGLQNIRIVVQNVSAFTLDTVNCGYTINGTPYPGVQFLAGLLPGQTDTFLLGSSVFSLSNNTLCAFASSPGDTNSGNDTLCMSVSVLPMQTIPYLEDFESGNGGWSQTAPNATLWEYGTPNYLQTSSAHSGNYCWDINLDTAYSGNANAILNTPAFDLSSVGLCRLSFWMNYFVESNWDGTRMEYSTDNGLSWLVLGSYADPLGINWYNDDNIISSNQAAWTGNSNSWKQSSYILSALTGQNNVRFRFVFTSDPSVSYQGISIDDFSIAALPDYDGALVNLRTSNPAYAVGTTSDPILFSVRNHGGQAISNFNFSYSVNGVFITSGTQISTILPGDTAIISLPGFILSQASNVVCGTISVNNDADSTNNSFCFQLAGINQYTPTFIDDFDTGNLGWYTENTGTPGTTWELGTPQYGATTGAYSAPSAWDINLNSGYQSGAHCSLYSPIFDLSSSIHPRILFKQNRNTEQFWDGLRIDYKTANDTNWYTMGILNDTNGINWYNDSSLNSSFKPGWAGSSIGWIQCEYNLDALTLNNSIQLRFVFTSDLSQNTDGVSIDDFAITTVYSNDAALLSILSPGSNAIQGVSTNVEVYLQNKGSLPVSTLNIVYRLNGGSPVIYNWNGNLLTDSMVPVSLPSLIPAGGPNALEVYIDWPSDLYQGNDTVRSNFFGVVTAGLPYFYDFEAGSNGWGNNTGPGNTNWELGQPNFPPLNTTFSGNSCWDINLNSPYYNLAQAILTSPIFDLSPYNQINIQFWLNYSSESGADGMFVEYSTNGNTWQRLGNLNDPAGINWYNSAITQSQIGWSGISNGWQSSSYSYLSPWGNSYLQLRFRFISDFNVVNAGFSLDDISITGTTGTNDLAPTQNFSIHPNPAKNIARLQISNHAPGPYEISIFSASGQLVGETIRTSKSSLDLPIQNLADGLYLVQVLDSGKAVTKKKLILIR
ncbi:MAG: immune inhibitor A [Bacteroidia bacterium]|nr:immune inhibitor A [Bacteroidia bacterium]